MATRKNNPKSSLLIAAAIIIFILLTLTVGEFTDVGLPGWSDGLEPESSAGDMIIHSIDVEQGDCTLVQGGGVNILIDAGESGMGKTVRGYLESIGVDRLDWVIGSHPHSDHIGGLSNIIKKFPVGNVMLPRLPDEIAPTSRNYMDLMEAILDKDMEITAPNPGDVYTFGEMTMTVLSPQNPSQYTDYNDCSLALIFECGGTRFFTAGDIGKGVEKDLMARDFDLRADIYKASHHGSKSSNSAAFLRAVSPKYAFIPSKKGNPYKHPHQETLDRLKEQGVKYYRSDLDGTIVFRCAGGKIKVTTEK